MIVPEYWAEARLQRPRAQGQPQVTVRRFGWSDVGQAEAERMARERAEEALRQIISGEKLPRRDWKVPYGGADGLPIREEILERHGDVVITRNAYGAHCLNTPDVFFADVDFEKGPPGKLILVTILVLLAAAAFIAGWLYPNAWGPVLAIGVACALVSGFSLAKLIHRFLARARGGAESVARRRIERFAIAHPDWRIALTARPRGFE